MKRRSFLGGLFASLFLPAPAAPMRSFDLPARACVQWCGMHGGLYGGLYPVPGVLLVPGMPIRLDLVPTSPE
jgi:hypothetical protein